MTQPPKETAIIFPKRVIDTTIAWYGSVKGPKK